MFIRAALATPGENLLRLEVVDVCSLLSNPLEITPTPSRLRQAGDLLLGLR